jgi:hypothetical protein
MGTWFPDRRSATAEQVRTYRDAHKALFRNGRYELKAGIREETPRYLDLNDRACETGRPLSPVQRWRHWQRALNEEDRDMGRLQQAADQQERARRRTGRSR